ncbi:MAG: site-2 protease family protein [Phycisphaerae bacterium]|nr:site-2 protease family protein [Phycisphaerae bacterium]MDD5381533.1 site-2 protease family protein [Phycisphaerae bacterium]
MSKAKGAIEQYIYAVLWVAVFAAVINFAVRNIGVFGNVLLVALGFGAFVLVHEFGHFLLAKLCGIKVEAFSIGFPPTLVGILRTEKGMRIRILPQFFPKGDGSDDGRLSFTVGKKEHQPGETEYRIGAIPFGGFVKMLGQEDVGQIKECDDPRSFANKPVSARMAVIAAGVVFNAISALIVFMVVFLIGINRVPAVVGGVVPGSPAAQAGLTAGDEVIEIAGRNKNLDYYDIAVEAALSGKEKKVALKVRHEDGSIGDYTLVAEKEPGDEMKKFGIVLPQSLIVAKISDANDVNELFERTGLRPGDRIVSVDGRSVQNYWEFEKTAQDSIAPAATVKAERIWAGGESGEVEAKIKLSLIAADIKNEAESETGNICSMVPRMRLEDVSKEPPPTAKKLKALFGSKEERKEIGTKEELQSGDIVLAAGEVENPTYKELRDVTTKYEDKEMPIKVLRKVDGTENELTVTVTPKRSKKDGPVLIGVGTVFDAEHPVVAKTISTKDYPELDIPRGAVITAVDKVKVSSFYDVVREIRQKAGKRIEIAYRAGEKETGSVKLDVKADENFAAVKSVFADLVPFKPLERLYKASGPVEAIGIGYRKTVMFIAQAYITLKGLVGGLVSPKSLMGPVGIISLSYKIVAERPLIDYAYFLGLISASIAVFNILPLLPFDGGFIVFLLIEKIKGTPVSVRVQEKIASVGWMLVIALILYVTFNDIIRSFFS